MLTGRSERCYITLGESFGIEKSMLMHKPLSNPQNLLDSNTRFFYTSIKAQQTKKQSSSITNDEGISYANNWDAGEVFVCHF